MGFDKAANPDVVSTFKAAIDKINALPTPPAFILHTGDISHLSKPAEFDTVDQLLKGASAKDVFFVPGEHDVLNDDGKQYLERYGKGTQGSGWYSFDNKGVHFVGLVNVMNLKAGGLGSLGAEQLEWLEKDVKHLSKSTPIVVFAHIPLWSVYPEWGWGTDDSGQALSYLKRFGSVTVLNGHIHQTMQKVEGNITFPHRDLYRISPAQARTGAFTRTDEGSGRSAAKPAGRHRRQLRPTPSRPGHDGQRFGLSRNRRTFQESAMKNKTMDSRDSAAADHGGTRQSVQSFRSVCEYAGCDGHRCQNRQLQFFAGHVDRSRGNNGALDKR